MEPTLVVSMAGEDIPTAGITVQEMRQVKLWTGATTRREWMTAILAEDPDALIAAYCIAQRRHGEDLSFKDADFDLDTLTARFVAPDGREVEPKVERDRAKSPKLDDKGQPIPVLDKKGAQVWVYTDTSDDVPPTETAPATT